MADGDDRVARLLVAAAVWLGSPRWWRGLLVGIQPPADAHRRQAKSFLACSLNSRIGSAGPTSMKVTPPSATPVCPAGQWFQVSLRAPPPRSSWLSTRMRQNSLPKGSWATAQSMRGSSPGKEPGRG
jgi:hypothetical protein